MNLLKHKVLNFALLLALLTPFIAVSSSSVAFAQTNQPNESTSGITPKKDDCRGDSATLNADNCGIIKFVIVITNIMGGLAGLVIVGTMIAGGIRYSSAGADPSKVQAAKQMIINAILALLLLIFGFSILQWLVPGGLF